MIAYTTAGTVPSKRRLPKMTQWLPLPTDKGQQISEDRIKQMLKQAKAKINGGE